MATISTTQQNYSSYLHWQWSLVDAAQSDIGYVGDRDHHVSQRALSSCGNTLSVTNWASSVLLRKVVTQCFDGYASSPPNR